MNSFANRKRFTDIGKKNKQTTYGYQKGKSGENKLGGWD